MSVCQAIERLKELEEDLKRIESLLMRNLAALEQRRKEIASLRSNLLPTVPNETGASIFLSLADVEKNHILFAARHLGVVKAAEVLGIGKTTVYRKLKEWGFSRLCAGEPEQEGEERVLPL